MFLLSPKPILGFVSTVNITRVVEDLGFVVCTPRWRELFWVLCSSFWSYKKDLIVS